MPKAHDHLLNHQPLVKTLIESHIDGLKQIWALDQTNISEIASTGFKARIKSQFCRSKNIFNDIE
ncbi:hypothetical protein ELY21_00300 [Legionella sp. km535]|uniref:hypothetical protein n=1 Tax=Legionella sp. km535 TaxID=2498107 RepID=UPI000F8C352E|nr:hypothetical protein [Legionella sp. km535]RUR20564.1 hypothetical protein ELY21_00300 [Legionella sp. km535]